MASRAVGWLVGGIVGLGCSGGGPAQKPVARVPWGEPGASSGASVQARWAYTPAAPQGLLGRISLGEKRELYFGRRGERWLVEDGNNNPEAAGDLAEQDLVAATRNTTGGWLFIGKAGAIFEADEPLGPFRRALAAPEPVARVEASPQGLLAVTLRGSLLRSGDGGATFQRAPLDAPFVADVQLLESGQGLLLAYPERLFETRDGGLQWKPLDAQSVGAIKLHRVGEDGILVQGVVSSLVWKSSTPLRSSRAQPETAVFQLPVALSAAPDAASVSLSMGFWRGDQFHELQPPEKRGGVWSLGVSKVGQRMAQAPLEGTEGCQRLAIDGNELDMVVACSTLPPRGASVAGVRLLRYASGGGAPEEQVGMLEGPLGEARVALGKDGRILMWGVCRAGSSRASCDSETALLLPRWIAAAASEAPPAPPAARGEKPEAAPSPWLSVAVPGQSGRPVAVRFGSKPGLAYMVAQRGKTRDLGLFVSRDGGRSFEGRELGLGGALEGSTRLLAGLRSASLSVLDEGIVSIGFEGQSGALVAVTDEDGRVLSVSAPPVVSATARVGLAGRRALAVEGSSAFESLDGGVSWTPLGDVPALRCPERGTCERRVSCGLAGCVVGDTASRVGWGGQDSGGRRAIESAAPTLVTGRTTQAPVVCRLSKEKWQPLPHGAEIPSFSRVERGKTAWSSSVFKQSNGQVTVVHGLSSPSPKIEEVTLMPAARDPARTAMYVSPDQFEGVAALRMELTPRRDAPPTVSRVEVAWENLFEGKLSRATLPAPSARGTPDLDAAMGQVSGLRVPLVSISNGGIFVRLEAGPGGELMFVDHRGKIDRSVYPPVPTQDSNGDDLNLRSEAVRVDNKSVVIAIQDAMAARLKSDGMETMSLFPAQGSAFQPVNHHAFAYLNNVPYLVHIGQIPQAGTTQISAFPFQASGPLLGPRIAGPTQRAVAERHRVCSAQDRARTPRVIAPVEPGVRRGVLIEGPDGSPFASMVSGEAILYGTSESPCVSVVEGVPAREDARAMGGEYALVSMSEPDRGWFFRAGVGDVVETRLMTCKLSPGAPLPPEVQTALDASSTPGVVVTSKRRPSVRIRKLAASPPQPPLPASGEEEKVR